MKRIDNLYNKICSMDNLILADKKARRGKKNKKEIHNFDRNKNYLLLKLQNDLIDQKFKTSDYRTFIINEYGKERIIHKLPYYPDRIVHHAVMNVLEPIWVNIFIRNTFSCIKHRGIHDLLYRIKEDLINKEETKYCLKFDIKKFYYSINHQILQKIIRLKLKDEKLLILLDEIIESNEGVPIGNYLSQYFANLYLAYFDHWMKEVKKIKYYYRYADDIVILHHDKYFLSALFNEIESYLLMKLELKIKENYQIFPSNIRGIDFIGYVIRKKYILLRKSIKNRLFRKIYNRKIKSISSYDGWLKHCNSYNLKNKIIMVMKNFSEMGINLDVSGLFVGEKISITKIINKDIIIKSFKLDNSKYDGKKCLTLQINVDDIDRIVFTSSKVLISQIEKIKPEDFPFKSKIEIFNKNGYIFT